MKLMNPCIYYYKDEFDSKKLKRLERAARLCYKSTPGNKPVEEFISDKIKSGHESVIEHEKITLYFVCDRGVTHEIVRHRLGSYSQESTRYCNYTKDKFGNQITFINIPVDLFRSGDSYADEVLRDKLYERWLKSLQEAEDSYEYLIRLGVSPQIARGVLPNSLKTEIAVTYNIREWRHFFKLRTEKGAHPQMRQLAISALEIFEKYFPSLVADISATLTEEDRKATFDMVSSYGADSDEDMDKFLKEFVNSDASAINKDINIRA